MFTSLGTIIIGCFVAIGVAILIWHFFTYSKYYDWMGWTFGKDFRKFAKQKNWGKKKEYPIYEIPAPPDGKRDKEIEELFKSGKISEARELIELKIEEARNSPFGSEEK